jgi:hypothetical protein
MPECHNTSNCSNPFPPPPLPANCYMQGKRRMSNRWTEVSHSELEFFNFEGGMALSRNRVWNLFTFCPWNVNKYKKNLFTLMQFREERGWSGNRFLGRWFLPRESILKYQFLSRSKFKNKASGWLRQKMRGFSSTLSAEMSSTRGFPSSYLCCGLT